MKVKGLALVALLAGACATAGGGGGGLKVFQADHRMPDYKDVGDDTERAELKDTQTHTGRAADARTSGNMDQARQESKLAADALLKLAERYPSSEWRIVYRRAAAENYLQAADAEGAARAADLFRTDKDATPATQAFGARLAAGSLQQLAFQKVKAGELEPVKIGRKTELKPRPPAETWKRYIDAADAYAVVYTTDPSPTAEHDAALLQLLAAEVQYSHDNIEEAQKRFEAIFQKWPLTAAAVDGVGPYLLTFPARKDMKGYGDAVVRMQAMLESDKPKAQAAASASGATAEQKALPEKIASVLQQLGQEKNRLGYAGAMELLKSGKPAEAAAGFEEFVAQNPDSPDAANALYNAGVAYVQAKEPKKAEEARRRLLDKYPDAPEAGIATVALATSRLQAHDTGGAVQLYDRYLEKWPDGEQRCLALGNAGAALEQGNKKLQAAARYRTFGQDARCAKDDPNTAARALYNSGVLYYNAKKRGDAKAVWSTLVNLKGIDDPVTKSQMTDARQRLESLK